MPLEPTIAPLRIAAFLVLGLRTLLAPDRQDIVVNADVDVLLVYAGQLGGDADLLVGFRQFDRWPLETPPPATQGWYAEASEDIVEQTVHVAVQGRKRVVLVGRLFGPNGSTAFLPAPGKG